jgi:predicted MFS family arabinose efflux permease
VRAPRASTSVVLFLCMFAGQAALLVLSPMLPDVAAHFGVSTPTAGQLRSASGAIAGAVALGAGVVASRVGLRGLLTAGLALLALGSLLSAAAPTFLVLLIAQLPIGAGLALVLGGALAAAGQWAPPGQRSRVLSWALLGPPAAWVIGMPVAGAAVEVTWRAAWLVVPFAASLAALAALRSRDKDHVEQVPEHAWRLAWRQPGVPSWAFGELCAYAAWTGTLIYVGALFVDSYGVSAGLVGLLLAGAAVAYMPRNFLARRWVDTHARRLLVALALGSAVLVGLFATVRPGVAISFGLFAVLAFLSGGRTIAGSAFGLDAAPEVKAVVMGLRAAALQFGYLLGAALGGAALTAAGYPGMGMMLAVLYLAAASANVLAAARARAGAKTRAKARAGTG